MSAKESSKRGEGSTSQLRWRKPVTCRAPPELGSTSFTSMPWSEAKDPRSSCLTLHIEEQLKPMLQTGDDGSRPLCWS